MSNETNPLLVIVILILAASSAYAGYNYGHVNATTPSVVTVVTPTPTPVPTPTAPAAYWTGALLVTGLTTGAGWPEAVVMDGRAFQISYSDYDRISPQDYVSFYVVSTSNPYGTIIYNAETVNIVSHHYSNTRYYYYDHKYWRNDDRVTIEVTRDEANEHGYSRERPNWWLDDE